MSEEKKGRPEDYDEDEWAWDKFGPSAPGNNFDALSCAQHYYDRGYLEALGDCKDALLPIIKGKLAVAARQKGLELELHVENIIGNIYPDFGQAVYELELKSRAGKEENK